MGLSGLGPQELLRGRQDSRRCLREDSVALHLGLVAGVSGFLAWALGGLRTE